MTTRRPPVIVRLAAVLTAAGLASGIATIGIPPAGAGDWPQILGPSRDGVAAADEQLAAVWPPTGPRVQWSRTVGSGYAGVAVTGDTVVLFHRIDDREVVEALDAATGASRWQDGHATRFRPQVGGGDGPLCVPVIHDPPDADGLPGGGGSVIIFGPQGVLSCHDLTTGRRRWSRDTHREFGGVEGYFGAGSTPVVVGDRVVVNVGGARQEAGLVALALDSGATLWQATSEAASYAAPIVVDVDGRPHVLVVTRLSCLLVDPADGGVRWSFPFGQRGPTVNAATPVVPTTGRLLVTASYGVGSVLAAFDGKAARPLWQGIEPLASQYCTPVVRGGDVYCIDGRDDLPPADLVCFEAETGRERWRERGFGYGTLLAADGKLLAVKAGGEIVLLAENPARFEPLARARPLPGTLRALPALAGGRLYVRDDTTLVCLDLGR
jgi:outer membrane protein assembly factor BamB